MHSKYKSSILKWLGDSRSRSALAWPRHQGLRALLGSRLPEAAATLEKWAEKVRGWRIHWRHLSSCTRSYDVNMYVHMYVYILHIWVKIETPWIHDEPRTVCFYWTGPSMHPLFVKCNVHWCEPWLQAKKSWTSDSSSGTSSRHSAGSGSP